MGALLPPPDGLELPPRGTANVDEDPPEPEDVDEPLPLEELPLEEPPRDEPPLGGADRGGGFCGGDGMDGAGSDGTSREGTDEAGDAPAGGSAEPGPLLPRGIAWAAASDGTAKATATTDDAKSECV